MRLISQDKTIDVPYEVGAVVVQKIYRKEITENQPAKIYFCADFTPREQIILAEYSSQKKALKAMEMVRQAYTGVTIFQNVEPTEDVLEILKNMSMQPMLVTNTMNQHTERIDNYSNVVFQFPKDDEIEV